MDDKIRVWLDRDRDVMHHASSSQSDGMHVREITGSTDCGQTGVLTLVHHENVDMGRLCEGCMAVSGPNPPLEGIYPGPP